MKTVTAVISKLFMVTTLALLTFYLVDGNDLATVLALSVLVTTLNYVVGDLRTLPAFGNALTSIAEGIVWAAIFYGTGYLPFAFRTTNLSLIVFAVFLALSEAFFHTYLLAERDVLP